MSKFSTISAPDILLLWHIRSTLGHLKIILSHDNNSSITACLHWFMDRFKYFILISAKNRTDSYIFLSWHRKFAIDVQYLISNSYSHIGFLGSHWFQKKIILIKKVFSWYQFSLKMHLHILIINATPSDSCSTWQN